MRYVILFFVLLLAELVGQQSHLAWLYCLLTSVATCPVSCRDHLLPNRSVQPTCATLLVFPIQRFNMCRCYMASRGITTIHLSSSAPLNVCVASSDHSVVSQFKCLSMDAGTSWTLSRAWLHFYWSACPVSNILVRSSTARL